MPIYEYKGRKYNIPAEKAQELTTRMPGAKLVEEAPFYLSNNPNQDPPKNPHIDMEVPEVNQNTFDSELARQSKVNTGITLGEKPSIADTAQDMYQKRELTRPIPQNKAQQQEGFWASVPGDVLEKLGAGAVRLIAGLGEATQQSESTMAPGEKIEGQGGESQAIKGWFGAAEDLSEKGDRYGVMVDPETGETRKKTYKDLWKEGKPLDAAGEALLTGAESGITSAVAMIPGAGLPLVAISAAGQKYNQIENSPETKDLPEWKKILNASLSGAIEGLTERVGAKVDIKAFEPILKKMTEKTVKQIVQKGGVNALIQTLTEGGEEVLSQLGTNVVDYGTGVSKEYKPLEGVGESFVYGAAGGAQFGGITGAGTLYRAAEKHAENVQKAKTENSIKLYQSISDKRNVALPTLNKEKQQLEAELGDLVTLPFEEVANSKEATPELIEARRRYDIVNAEYEGVMDNLKKEVDEFIAPQVKAIEDIAKDGIITELNIGTQDNPEIVYLANGNVAVQEDGVVDPKNTSPILTVKTKDGKKKIISRNRIITAQQDDLNTIIEGISQQAYENLVKPVADKLEGKTHFQQGESVEYVNAKGETVAGTVASKQNNTVTIVDNTGEKTETFTEDELGQRLLGETIDDIKIRDVIKVNLDGQEYDADVVNIQDGVAELHIPSFPEAAGRYLDVNAEELRRIRINPSAETTVQPPENVKTSEKTPENGDTTTGEIEQNASKTAETTSESQTPITQEGLEVTSEQQREQLINSLPKTKEGEIDYDKIEDDDTFVTALQSEFDNDAPEIVEEYRKQAEKKLKDAGRIEDPIRRKRAQKQAQKRVDRFQNMYERLNPRTAYETRVADIQSGNIKERESKLGEYKSLRDYLLRNIATGRFKFRWNDNGTNKGLVGELFATKNQEAEKKKRISFLNNNGYSPESLAEYIAENAGQGSEINPGWFTDTSDIRGEIIDVLLSYDTPSSMIEESTRLAKQPETLEEYAENFVDPAVIFEYEANEASQDEMLRSLPTTDMYNDISDAEVESYFSEQIDADEYDNYIKSTYLEQKNKQDGIRRNERTRAGSDREDVGQITGTEKAADDSGRDSRIISGNQDEGSSNIEAERETAVSGERSTSAGVTQPTAEGTIQEDERPAAGPQEGINESITQPIKVFSFKQDSRMLYGRAMNILEKRYRYPDGKVMTRYEWIESLPAGLEANVIKVAANNEKGYNEILTLDGIDITKTELDYYEYLQQGGMTISEKKEEDHRKYIEDKKRENAEKAAKDEESRRKDEEIRKIREQDRKNLIRDAIVLSRDEFIEKGTKREREYVESFNRRRKKDSAYERDLSIAENNLDAVTNIAAKFFDMARSVYSLDENGEPVRKHNYKVGDEVVVTSEETPIKTAIKEIKGDIYVVEERDGIYNTHVDYEYIRPVNESPVDIIQKAKEEVGKDKQNKLKKEADDALKDFLDAFNDLNSDTLGIIENSAEKQAKMLIAGTRLVGAYTKLGVYKFADMVNAIAQKGIQITDDLLRAIKQAYGAFAAENDIDGLDDMRTVRSFSLENIQKTTQTDENKPDKISESEKISLSLDGKDKFVQEVFDRIGKERLTILSLRKIADRVGLKDVKDTTLQEYAELAIINRARQIANQDLTREEKFRDIVQLYEDQPTISMRSSERISKQQYSTPIPIAFIADEFVNGIKPKRVLEPSAGNGMMVYGVDPKTVIANEIDDVRLENLREQSFKDVLSQDATQEFNIEPVDAVLTNPPFGKSEVKDYEGYKISGLDEQMVVNALQKMKDDGRAAVIIGGHTKYNTNGSLAAERPFLNYLYDKYNVVDLINIEGSLYSKQGTSFPIRLILIDGRRTGFDAIARRYAPLQKDARSEVVKSFDKLLQRLDEDEKNLLHKRATLEPDNREGRNGETQSSDRGTVQGRTPTTGGQGSGGRGESGTSGNRQSKDVGLPDNAKPNSKLNDDRESDISDIRGDRGKGADRGSGRDTGRIPGEDVLSLYDGSRTRSEPLKIDLDSEKTRYPARSKSEEIGSVVPTNMVQALDEVLYKFKDIDAYVQTKLGYETKEVMFDALSAEQIDGVAMAINQIENGQGIIIGDMTGVGKGRQAAAIIRYAVRQGKKPIFLTERANLFSDMYRDLRDIGSSDLKPFIVNSKGPAGDPSMTDENGIVIYSPPSPKVKNEIIRSQTVPDKFDYVAITYSQLSGDVKKKGMTEKQSFFTNIANDNILILDESHNAGGDGNTGQFMASVLPFTKGVTYLSATFAKRPDNMPVYALKTAMSDANMSDEELIEAIKKGGVPLQEIMSRSLSETGQMVRRERDFSGVTIDWEQITEDTEAIRERFDGVIKIFNDLIKFQEDYIDPAIERMNDIAALEQGEVETRKGTAKMGISNVPFASKTFNLVRQLLFSIKAEHIANEAIKEIKAGRKPVIAIGNTMETFLTELGNIGEPIEKHDFSLSLRKGLDGLFRVTEVDATGDRIHKELPLSILSAAGKAKYDELSKMIDKFSSGVTISPIDAIKDKITKAGYSIGEMTGRKLELIFDDKGVASIAKRQNTDKKKTARDFNNGEIDALILNQASATGISLHASDKFKDQRQRVMLFAQNQLDVNTEVQIRGRIDRTGQVVRGAYRYMISPIPAEQRLIMMFKAKLKSLDANTTSSQKSKTNEIEVVDFLNKYGDEVVMEYLKENPDINEKLLDPFDMAGLDEEALSKIGVKEGAANKIAGHAALLTVREQEQFYEEVTDKYNTLLQYLNDVGENDLEIAVMPLNAETKARHIVIEGKNNGNPFAENSIRETVEVDVLKKPMTLNEIDDLLQSITEGKSEIEYRDATLALVDEKIEAQIKMESKNIRERRAEKKSAHTNDIDYDDITDSQILKRDEKIRETGEAVKRFIRMFPAGAMVMMPSTMNIDSYTTFSEGIFIGFRMKDKVTPSTVTAIFAPHDGRRRIDVPLSKADFLRAIYSETMANRRWMQINRDNWDKSIPNRTRKTAYIITGNILQAYGRNELRGQLVSYTTSNGGIKQGILLPERYKADEQSMRVQVKNAADLLIKQGESLVDRSNGVVIEKVDDITYTINVPLSKARGGIYFLDEGLRDLVVGHDFKQLGQYMTGVVKSNNIEKALAYLSDKFNISVETKMKEVTEDEVPDDLRFRTIDDAGFYSTVEEALDEIKQEKGSAEQMKAMLLKNGAKQAEMDWMGWDDHFPDVRKMVNKNDIQEWIDQNRIEVEEVENGVNKKGWFYEGFPDKIYDTKEEAQIAAGKDFANDADSDEYYDEEGELTDRYEEDADEYIKSKIMPISEAITKGLYDIQTHTEFSQYTEPGGENYRELLLTIPTSRKSYEIRNVKTQEIVQTSNNYEDLIDKVNNMDGEYVVIESEESKGETFKSSHFNEPNIIAHVRFDDRNVNGEKVLFIEEIQSDWAQSGKKQGFKWSDSKIEKERSRLYELRDEINTEFEKYLTANNLGWDDVNRDTWAKENIPEKYNTYKNLSDEIDSQAHGVPDMPFKNTDQWVNLAFRRMMRYAAENGYDRLSWTTGDQQVERYDLSKQVDEIVYNKLSNGKTRIIIKKAGKDLAIEDFDNSNAIEGFVGKEIAKKIENGEGTPSNSDKSKSLSGIDLKVGGEGMRAFYDQIIPKAAKKLGKPFGANLETINIITEKSQYEDLGDGFVVNTETGEPETGIEKLKDKTITVQSIPVTDQMREVVPMGMPLFSLGEKGAELDEKISSAKDLDAKVDLIRELIGEIEKVHKSFAKTVILKNKAELLDVMKNEGVGRRQLNYVKSSPYPYLGAFYKGTIYLNAEANNGRDDILKTWVHENFHAWVTSNENTLLPLVGKFSNDLLDSSLGGGYRKLSKRLKTEELLAFSAERIYVGGYLTSKPEIRQYIDPIIKTYLDDATEGRFSESNPDFGRGRRSVQGSLRDKQGSLQQGARADETGEGTDQRRPQDGVIFPGNERIPAERLKEADRLYENIDDLKSVVKNYSKFLGDVFNGPGKDRILDETRKIGFDKLGTAIENYLANVEDPSELGRIKQLLGVDMPDNALQYMLWRNVNPNDGTIVWRARDAVKTRDLDANILFKKGEIPSEIKENEYEKRVRSRYNRGFRSLMYGIEEGWVDRMASLRILQNAITGGKAVPDSANAYMIENHLTSRNTAEMRFYNTNFIDPFIEKIHKLFKDLNAADIYMNAKHGVERNRHMANEEAERKYSKKIAELQNKLEKDEIDQSTFDEGMIEIRKQISNYADKLFKEKDYSGLTAIAAEKGREDFMQVALEIIDEVEGSTSVEEIDRFWEIVNNATKWTIEKQYNSGMMTKDAYEKIRTMYKYYVPLRGFDELTATDLYEYLQNPPSDFNKVLKTARGRTSKADSPTATIMNMAESGIMQANRNRMKQAFYRLVATNPSNYASIEDVWYVETADGFEERFPDISPDATADEVLEKIADFNNDMAELASEGKAFQGRNKLNVGVKIMKAQASEHVVRVWIAGEEKVIFINGNPRAAQAINGLTQNDLIKKSNIRHGVEFWSRQMAANFTSRNPAFMVTNLMRDMQFALISASVKEGMGYSTRLAKNFTIVGKTIATNVFGEGNKDNPEFQKYWEEFLYNGGETGYANLHSIDYQRKYVNKKLREFSDQRDFIQPFRAYVQFMESSNRTVEDLSRFATYVTSRQEGRSIERSVSDAKEITINFNRKGSGGFMANFVHTFYLFANPAIQGLRLMGVLAKNHPVRFTTMLSSSMAAGALVPLINELLINLFGDDDKEMYQNITPWVRRNNIVVYNPFTKDKFITWMLPHEIRPFYGIGEMCYDAANGGLRRKNLLGEAAKQMTTMLPIDPFSGMDWWIPDFAKPIIQSYVINQNFMGTPIYRDTEWNKFDPEWTKAYKRTPDAIVEAAKWASEVSGGDEVVPGKININPARIDNLLRGYMGGFLTTYTDLTNIAFSLLTGKEVSANDIPVVNKMVRTSDQQTEELRINSEYFYYLNWIKEYEHKLKGYEKRIADPEYAEKWIDMLPKKEQRMYEYAKSQVSLIKEISDYDEKEASRLKEEFVRTMWKYEDED